MLMDICGNSLPIIIQITMRIWQHYIVVMLMRPLCTVHITTTWLATNIIITRHAKSSDTG
ncbi:hypothetical protein D3C75_550990 [compost metagenome]